jgi:phosphoserine phosphatase
MSAPGLRTAIVYDFDGTLAPANIQEHSLIPEHLGIGAAEFWAQVDAQKRVHNADSILVFLHLLMERARAAGKPLTRAILEQHGKDTPVFDGVESWFDRIGAHAAERSLQLEHYIISSGNEEMIRACRVAQHFTYVFGSNYVYDADGYAVWPGTAVNYTTKTQYLFRINKGVLNHWNDAPVNRWIPMADRPLPFSRMVYLGDGDTDIPSMKMIRHQGGHSVAVFDPTRWAKRELQPKVYDLIAEDRAHFVVPADYTDGSQLDITIKGILGRIARDEAGYRGKS